MKRMGFPRWANKLVQLTGVALGVAPLYLIGLIWYGASPKTLDVGYAPKPNPCPILTRCTQESWASIAAIVTIPSSAPDMLQSRLRRRA